MIDKNQSELVAGLRQGNAAVLREIYELFRPRIFGYLVRLSGSRDIAEELSSEVWCRVASKSKDIREDSNLSAWLYTIARNLFFSYCRWRDIHEQHAETLARYSESQSTNPFDKAVKNQQEQLLEEGLKLIGTKYREALILVEIEGFSYTDAAKICDVREPAMRKRVSRAKKLLKQVISELSGTGKTNKEGS